MKAMANEQTMPSLDGVSSPSSDSRHLDARRLKQWFLIYLILWIGMMIWAAVLSDSNSLFAMLLVPVLGCYIVSIVYAYKVQKALCLAGLSKHGAWQVVVGAVIVNPFFFGALIPASVLWANRRSTRRRYSQLRPTA